MATDEVAQGVQRYNARAAIPVAARMHTEAGRFVAGMDLAEPDVVHRWRPGARALGSGHDLAIYAAGGRKP